MPNQCLLNGLYFNTSVKAKKQINEKDFEYKMHAISFFSYGRGRHFFNGRTKETKVLLLKMLWIHKS